MQKFSDEDREAICRLRLDGVPPKEIYPLFPHIPPPTQRKFYSLYKLKRAGPSPPKIIGTPVGESELDEEAVWQRAVALSARRLAKAKRERDQRAITFAHGPICLAHMADLHLGGSGVDYARLDADIDIILRTPGMYVNLVGDVLDNFIIGRLKDLRMGTEFTVSEEWVLVKRVLRRLAPKLLISVAGNHDLWTFALSGVDYLREIHAQINPNILYAKYENRVRINVGDATYTLQSRHSWRGYSQWNATHGIEKAAKFDGGKPFDIGVGAHTHASGLCREFNNGGGTGIAILCGSYKRKDNHADQVGFPGPNKSATVCTIFGEGGDVWGTGNLMTAVRYMNVMYGQ